jgi:cytochrome c
MRLTFWTDYAPGRLRNGVLARLAMRASVRSRFACAILALAAALPEGFAAGGVPPAGDPEHGKAIYTQECKGCHALNETLIGPKHCGVFGRPAGTVSGYAYSEVMKQAGFVWDAKHLDEFLKSPITYLNGTNMGYVGLDSATDRADLIAYLRLAMDPAACAATSAKPAGSSAADGKAPH